ncbi:MAG TPA: BON domain-containing protein [Longimicrobiaceae bacterium]
MARYDGGWGRSRGAAGYDRTFGQGGVRPGYDAGHGGYAGPRGYDGGDFQWGGGGDEMTSVYGPARYGLGPYHDRLRRQRRPDEELRQEVQEALFYDTWVDADAITVEVRDGIVTLRGELPDYDEIRYATDDAWDIEGVRGVRSELTVREEGRAGSTQKSAQKPQAPA